MISKDVVANNFLLISTENNSRFSLVFGNFQKTPKIKIIDKAFKQSELLLAEINKIVGKNKLNGFIVVSGPGAFSGLRIGIATANALAYATKTPIVGVQLKKSWLKLSEREKIMKAWQSGVKIIKNSKFIIHNLVFPQYGAEPNIGRKKV